jgi:hypothetical protein
MLMDDLCRMDGGWRMEDDNCKFLSSEDTIFVAYYLNSPMVGTNRSRLSSTTLLATSLLLHRPVLLGLAVTI